MRDCRFLSLISGRACLYKCVGLLFACAFLGSAAVCAAPEKSAKQPQQRVELTLEAEEVNRPWRGDLDGMVERGFIRVLTTYSRTFFFTDKGVQRGITHDIFREFEENLNMQLSKQKKLKQKHVKVKIVFIPTGRDELLSALNAGLGDIAAANLTITEERKKQVDFSIPAYPDVSEVVLSGPASPAIRSIDDLSGKEVHVRKSSSFYESLLELNRRFASQKKPGVTIKLAPEVFETEDLIEMLNAGLLPLTIADNHVAQFWKQVFPKVIVHEEITLRSGADIAWAMRKNSPQLKAIVDDFVGRHGKGSSIGNVLLTRYLKSTKYVKDSTSEAERKKFLALIEYFKKYGEEYDIDWLLMAAQGYQESQLNQEVRSKVGAIGVMQIMPATGKDLNVGDIRQVEANIHGGIKYMRWMIDEYFCSEPMTNLDKVLFAFASYNAGPGRIAKLRQETARRGLNPNVWFRNVEYVAADKIGAETVSYVSNIFKYYIAYNLLTEAREEKEQAAKALKTQNK